MIDALDRAIIDRLQGDFPLVERPYAAAATALGIDEATLLDRLQRLLDRGLLSRFGPMYQIERMGGAFVLAAMKVADADWQRVVDQVNAFPEVAHNYRRESAGGTPFNMWFVLATENAGAIDELIRRIETVTGWPVFAFPKRKEYFVEMKLTVRG